ncbi:MAG TPA: 4-(cytidine 5'-diphospho)-2-C-methyl-D-erythritol kinase [Bauldia sp.]|nr:4-(cytidine 5'-diphospho)-2-C-methyl-D-erythritol kinase [Bauldia sp.]
MAWRPMTAEETADFLATHIAEAAAKIESARAKINLALHVLNRRPDGYHALDSLVVFAELADTLTAYRREESVVELSIDGDFAEVLTETTFPQDNLVYSVASALSRAFPNRVSGGVRLHLTKELPVAGGLGGGSADAAATLRLLNRIWRLGLTTAELVDLGANLGADVPVCVLSRPARIEGIGELVTPVTTLPAMPVVLVNPGVAMQTASVFRQLAPADRSPLPPMPSRFVSIMELVFWLRKTRNDLFEPACRAAPVIETAVRMLASDPDCMFARMSGSGATVFGIFLSIEAASRAAERIRDMRAGWWVAVTWTGGS